MPWQVVDGGLMLSGRLLAWVADLEEWYLEDVGRLQVCPDFGSYILLIVDGYKRLAKTEDGNDMRLFTVSADDTESLANEHEEGGLPLVALEVLDGLAETYDDDFRIRLSGGARDWAKRFMM
jgi:hypothetical protein